MATEATSGLGFVRYWASAPGLKLLELLQKYGTRKPPTSSTAQEAEAVNGKGETWSTSENVGLTPEGSTEETGVKDMNFQTSAKDPAEETCHILLLGIGDVHHILTTCAAAATKTNIHFYILEDREEVLARHILLLDVLNDRTLSLPERIETFLDVYGNCFLLAKTAAYIEQRVFPQLLNFASRETSHMLDEFVDLSHLKHRERDEIQDIMESWRGKVVFDMLLLRDQRLRHCYAKRFDYKVNVMDWNYQMNLTPSASIIHWKQYKSFALTGVAFERRLADQIEPNRTLSSYTPATDTRRYQNVKVRGFWGDIVNGPFYAYGVTTCECYQKRLFRKLNHQHRYNTQEIADFNLSRLLYKLEEGKELTLPPSSKDDDMYPLPSPAELLFRQRATSSSCGSSTPDSTAVSTVGEQKQTECTTSATTVDDNQSSAKREVKVASSLQLSDYSLEDGPACASPSERWKTESTDTTSACSIGSSRDPENQQQGCYTSEECGASTSSAATAPPPSVPGDALKGKQESTASVEERRNGIPASVLPGFRSTKVTLLKGDAAEVLRRRRYAGLFNVVVVANTATTTFLKECNLLDSAEGGQSGVLLEETAEDSKTLSSNGDMGSSMNRFGEIPEPSSAPPKMAVATSTKDVDAQTPGEERPSKCNKTYLSECLARNALLCVETFKYSATLDSVAKIRFRKLVARGARALNWTLCNSGSLPPMASEMMEHEKDNGGNADEKRNRTYSSAAATRQEAAADAYMIFGVEPISYPSATAGYAREG